MNLENKLLVVGPKGGDTRKYLGAKLLVMNLQEAIESSGLSMRNRHSVDDAGRVLMDLHSNADILVTRGEDGISIFLRDGTKAHVPAVSRQVYAVSGAGDTVLATVGMSLTSGLTVRESAILGNIIAGIVVGKIGTAVPSAQEVKELLA